MTTTLRSTAYADEIKTTSIGDVRLERLFVKDENQEEIRFSWWPNGNMANRPLDIPEATLIELLAKGVREGVLSSTFIPKLIGAIAKD